MTSACPGRKYANPKTSCNTSVGVGCNINRDTPPNFKGFLRIPEHGNVEGIQR
jgi:hypothetical protein